MEDETKFRLCLFDDVCYEQRCLLRSGKANNLDSFSALLMKYLLIVQYTMSVLHINYRLLANA